MKIDLHNFCNIDGLIILHLDNSYNVLFSSVKNRILVNHTVLNSHFKTELINNLKRNSFTYEGANSKKEIITYNVNINKTEKNITLIIQDKTDYVKLKKDYDYNLIRYRVLFWNAADYIFSLEPDEYDFTNANMQILRYLKLKRKDLLKLSLQNCFPFEKNNQLYDFIALVKEKGMGVIDDIKVINKYNQARYFNGLGIVMDIGAENSLYFSFRDITEYKKLQINLMQNEKLVSLGTLTAGIAHEVTQPLMAINLYVEILKNEIANLNINEEAIDENIAIIEEQIKRADDVISNMKNIFRKSSPDTVFPVDLNELIRNTIKFISKMFEKEDICLVLELSENKLFSNVNETLLMQVFLNILTNAKESMSSKSDLKQIFITTYNDENNNYVLINDTGPGLAEDNFTKIFDPFFSTKDSKKGTGLGLYISYIIINEFGGTITANNSDITSGAEFLITLPANT